jgi:hypothetical protein
MKLLRNVFISKREKRIYAHKYIGLFLAQLEERWILTGKELSYIHLVGCLVFTY